MRFIRLRTLAFYVCCSGVPGVATAHASPAWVLDCHRFLETPTGLPMRMASLRDGSVRTKFLALAAELAALEKAHGSPNDTLPTDTAPTTNSYERAFHVFGERFAILYGTNYHREDDEGVGLIRRLETVSKKFSDLSGIVDVDSRLYFDDASGLLLIRLQNKKA